MKKNGKSLEKLVTLIQKALSNQSNAQVFANYKIEDSVGGKREIDVMIISELNGFEILVAIECKDYSRPVGIDKIDAFKAKCDSIPRISKRVFVSTSGYASGAKRNAEGYGISLYEVSELTADSINNWFPKVAKLRLQLQIVDVQFGLGTDDERILNADTKIKPQLYKDGVAVHDHIFTLIKEEVKANYPCLKKEAVVQLLRNGEALRNEGVVQSCEINFPSGFSLLEVLTNEHIPLVQFLVHVKMSFIEELPDILNANSYNELNKENKLHQMSIDMGNDTKAEIVRTSDDRYEVFINNEIGELTQLSTLAVYDPEQDRFIDLLNSDFSIISD